MSSDHDDRLDDHLDDQMRQLLNSSIVTDDDGDSERDPNDIVRAIFGEAGGFGYHRVSDDDDGDEDEEDPDDDEDDEDYHDPEDAEDDDDDEVFHDAEAGDADDDAGFALELTLEARHAHGDDADEDDDDYVDEDNEDEDEEGEQEADEPPATLAHHILRLVGGRAGVPGYLTQQQIVALLRGHDLAHVLFDDYEEDLPRLRRRRRPDPNRFPKVPSEKGRELMESGLFGAVDSREPLSNRKRIARRLLDRELGIGDRVERQLNQDLMVQQMIPSSKPEMIIHYGEPVTCGQFSDDGNFFYTTVKDFRVRMYDTSNPYNWRWYKTVVYPFGQWTLTDAHLSPDNRWLAYSSLQPHICFAPTDPSDTGDPYTLDMSTRPSDAPSNWQYNGGFAIYSVRFSGDGRTLVCGTGSASIVVYDLERRQVLHNVVGHQDDVNAVSFADKLSPHILYSGSDDCTIKVWDTRSMADGREAGAFVGHIEGLTYIDSKGDGRYILSNAKDQTMKLWDLRMAMSRDTYQEKDASRATRMRRYEYDYRWEDYDLDEWFPHEHDNSVVTFRGHKVQRTLIRCHFSPPGSTNSRYVYSGSHDGFVYVWNLDATLAAKIDVKEVTKGLGAGQRRYLVYGRNYVQNEWTTLVRDVGWHPNAPMLVASAWNGIGMSGGTATIHSFNESDPDEAEPRRAISVTDRLHPLHQT